MSLQSYEMESTRPAVEPEPDADSPDMVDLATLKVWQREDVAHYLTYRDDGDAEEAAVYGIQWTNDEVLSLGETDREALVHNHIQKAIFAMYGWRSENRYEIQYKPKEISDTTEAGIQTEVAKHFWDACLAEHEMARASLSQYIGPMGWVYCGLENDDPSKEPFKLEFVPWREMRYDRGGTKDDLTDAERVTRERWYPLKKAEARWPEHKEALRAYAQRGRADVERDEVQHDNGGDAYSAANTTPILYLTDRKEVRVGETWYRVEKPGHYVKTPTGWVPFEPGNEDHQYTALVGGPKVVKPGTIHCIYYAMFFGGGILEKGKTPYSHPFFPYVPMWGLRNHKGTPQGAVHAMMDPQKVLNWTKSKLLWLAQGNQWLLPDGTVEDLQKFAEAAGRPDGLLHYRAALDTPAPQRLDQSAMVASNQALHQESKDDIKQIGGSPEEVRGQESNVDSGIGIQLKQEAAMRQQGIFLQQEERTHLQVGLMWRSMIQDLVTDETIVRIAQPNGAEAMAVINVQDPLRRADLEAQGYKVYGTVTRGNYDTKVILSPKSNTAREARSREQQQLAKILPPDQLALISDLLVMETDVKNRDQIAERLAAYNAMKLGQAPGLAGPMGPVGPDGQPVAPGMAPTPVPLGPEILLPEEAPLDPALVGAPSMPDEMPPGGPVYG